jgi:hypothetical protein
VSPKIEKALSAQKDEKSFAVGMIMGCIGPDGSIAREEDMEAL